MADNFPATIEAQIRGKVVRLADLVRFDFRSGEIRLWSGVGRLTAGGETWDGIGTLGQASAVTMAQGAQVTEVTYTLFGTEQLLEKFQNDADETAGREVKQYMQFFNVEKYDNAGNWIDWTTLDTPFQVFSGVMGPLIVNRPGAEAGATEMRQRAISVRASSAFINRRRPPFGYFSHADQLARSVGHNDILFVNQSRMALVTVRWPKFS